MAKTFDAEAPRSVQRMLDSLPETDPIIGWAVQKLGAENRGSWGDMLVRDLEALDVRGVRGTVVDEAKRIWSAQEMAAMEQAGVLQRVFEVVDQGWKDMNRTLRGNPARSTVERIANSYFVMWPISYQLKAGKWLYDILTHRMFGQTTNLGGAWTLSHLTDIHERLLKEDDDYVAMFEDNPETWFFAQMFVPITPFDLSVSLSRVARVVGGHLGAWEKPSYSDNPFLFASKIAAMGPVFTAEMLRRIGREQDPLDFLLRPFNEESAGYQGASLMR